jgi:serine/threonine protein kinase/tetratricopeptide (TPR) repeat protein
MADTEPRPPQRADSDFEHEVMAQCVEAWHAGGADAVETVLAQHPQLAATLRQRLEKLERAGLLGPSEDAATGFPEQLGEFRLIARLGSGGMGVVFLAEQMTLGRTVALKLVRPEQRFFPGARARFRREVEAIARLGDAGIVPIYTVGQDQGVDYFAMEHVRGASLGDVIAALHGTPLDQLEGRDYAVVAAKRGELPLAGQVPEVFGGTWVQASCRIVVRMARAVQHAHERGVVHRDLKPNNTMITPDGRVLLLDFGLAAAAGSARITRTGATLGTLQYMAPEQVREGDTDARTDVYALGVTLHELLALRSPFTAGSGESLRHQILHGETVPLRVHNPDVPRDVQTIVAVAMDHDPARRYQTANALADDLERFLQHRPIAARPVGFALRTVRWGQRHPARSTALLLTLLALLATPVLVRLSRAGTEAELETAKEEARARAKEVRDKDEQVRVKEKEARASLESALTAVEGILKSVRSPTMARTPGVDSERRARVQEAAALMERLIQQSGDDPMVRLNFSRGMSRVADFRREIGENVQALADIERAMKVLATLRDPADASVDRYAVDHAGLLLARGSVLVELGRVPEAAVGWQQVIDAYGEQPLAGLPNGLALALSSCHNNLGKVAMPEHDYERAIHHLEASLRYDEAAAEGAESRAREIDSVRTHINLGTVLRAKGDPAAARTRFEAVRTRLQKFAARLPGEPEVQRELARTTVALAALETDAKKFPAAIELRREATTAMQRLVELFPDRVQYGLEAAQMLRDLSLDQQAVNELEDAEASARLAIGLMDRARAKEPSNLEYIALHAGCMQNLAYVLRRLKRPEEALRELARAVEAQEASVAARPEDNHYRAVAASLNQEVGLLHIEAEHWQEARAAWRRARDHYETALAQGSAQPREPRRLPMLLTVLAQAEMMCDDFDGVVAALRRLQDLRPLPLEALRDIGGKLHVDDRADFQELVRAAEAKAATTPK